jgi:hypothetical protein
MKQHLSCHFITFWRVNKRTIHFTYIFCAFLLTVFFFAFIFFLSTFQYQILCTLCIFILNGKEMTKAGVFGNCVGDAVEQQNGLNSRNLKFELYKVELLWRLKKLQSSS